MVVHTCFQFHGKFDECFESRFPWDDIDFDFGDDNKRITLPCLSGQIQWVVGTAKINPNASMIATWTFKIHCIRSLALCIVDNENNSICSIHQDGRTHVYRWKCDGFDAWRSIDKMIHLNEINESIISFGDGDTFKVILDTYNKVIKWRRNEQSEIIIFKCNATPSQLLGRCPWKFMIRMQSYHKATSLSLINFEIVHVC